jgi:prophage regulatory protein
MGLSTLYAHIDRGMFPKPVALSRRFVVFPQEEVTAIINARLAGKTDDEVRELVAELMEKRRA